MPINLTSSLCTEPDCQNKGKYWRACGHKPKEEKRAYKISKVSHKQEVLLKEYKKLRIEYLRANPFCARCGNPATEIHHSAGRVGENLLDTSTFVALCTPCHREVEDNPLDAKKEGFSQSRLK